MRTLRLYLHLLRTDLVAHSLGSRAAAVWNLVLPAVVLLVYVIAFELTPGFRFAGDGAGPSYGVQLVAGLVPWLCFQEGLTRSANAFVDQRHLITQIPIPPLLFPLATVGSAFVRHLVSLVLLVLILRVAGVSPDRSWLALPLGTVALVLLTLGAGLCVAAGTVWQRDVAPFASGLLLPWFFATPVIYPSWMVPRTLRLVVDLNPLSGVVRAYRDILVTGHAPDWVALGYGAAFGVLLTGIGLDVVRRLSHDLAERL